MLIEQWKLHKNFRKCLCQVSGVFRYLHVLMIPFQQLWLHSCSYLSKPSNIFPYGENTAAIHILSTSHHHVITRIQEFSQMCPFNDIRVHTSIFLQFFFALYMYILIAVSTQLHALSLKECFGNPIVAILCKTLSHNLSQTTFSCLLDFGGGVSVREKVVSFTMLTDGEAREYHLLYG